MGQEISTTSFSKEDHELFHQKLREETKILKSWFDNRVFTTDHPKCGLELEAWLVSENQRPIAQSHSFLEKLNHPLVVPEISKYNFELNSKPFEIKGNVFSHLESETLNIWKKCTDTAESLNLRSFIIGTLPTLRDHMLTMECLSTQKRYFALNNQVMKLRENKPIILDLEGKDWIHVEHDNVITECAATSLQIHFGVNQDNAKKYYNASIISSSLIAALCANSPYLYGQELWEESRIPIFEQSVNLKSFRKANGESATRVSLGNGYVKNSILELFLENLDGYPSLLPECNDNDANWLDHLRLHNGTIWRWNRPLIGLSDEGKPTLRLEFRVPSSGPSITDSIANMVAQIAFVEAIADIENIEEKIPFEVAKENFYKACKYGLNADITWVDGRKVNIQELLYNELIPIGREKLKKYNIDEKDIQKYMDDIIHERAKSGQNGSYWQKSFVSTHGARFQEMLEMYYQFQKENIPVHLWKV
ncbi:MAG: hypothetical protein GY909_10735 [Oligoflexia bacterium]|nr:hypothetical protein [Oligoflexia bacterium]